MLSVSCSELCYIWLTNWPASANSIMLYYFIRAGLLMQSIWDCILCWVLQVCVAVNFPFDTACAVFWLLPAPSSRKDAGGWAAARGWVKETMCSGRVLSVCGVSAHSLKGVQAGSGIAGGSWQPGRSSACLYFALPWSFPKTVVYPRQGLKGAYWRFPSCNSPSDREENSVQLERWRNQDHVPGSDAERDVIPGLPYFLG